MNTSVATKAETTPTPATIEDVLIRGDLSKLTEAQRSEYYLRVCHSLGLNPLTRPFEYLVLSGRLVLYARRDATDQLRRINAISIEIVGQQVDAGLLIVHARARDKSGRKDEDFGVVAFKKGGNEFAANAMMKAVTKSKRRVTLSICGLGFLDETELPGQREAAKTITKEQREALRLYAEKLDANMPDFLDYLGERWEMEIGKIADIPADRYDDAMAQLKRKDDALAKSQAGAAGTSGDAPAHDPETGELADAE